MEIPTILKWSTDHNRQSWPSVLVRPRLTQYSVCYFSVTEHTKNMIMGSGHWRVLRQNNYQPLCEDVSLSSGLYNI